MLAYDPENLEAILARSKASKAAGRKLEALALLESGDSMATLEKISRGSVIENPGDEYYEMRQFYMVCWSSSKPMI